MFDINILNILFKGKQQRVVGVYSGCKATSPSQETHRLATTLTPEGGVNLDWKINEFKRSQLFLC